MNNNPSIVPVPASVIVCGAGTMGRGIAQLCAGKKIQTLLFDVNISILSQAKAHLINDLGSLVTKNKMKQQEADLLLAHLQFSNDLESCKADMIIEAIVEQLSAKIDLFTKLAAINGPSIVFATNTSSLPVTAIAEKIINPERVVGMHFFNPATIMKLVEVVHTRYTNEQSTATVISLAHHLGKTPVICKDAPGFIVNHVARPYYIEALRLLENGIADMETIDALMEATGFRMGPFRLMDLIGNDVNYAVSCSVYDALGMPDRLKPSLIQQKKVEQGELGRKTGSGYYKYGKEK